MMRIELRSQTEGEVVLRVAGWLEQGKRVVLDLEGLQALSVAGLALLHSWQGRPVELRRLPVLIGSLIALLHGPPDRPPQHPACVLQPLQEG